MNTRRITLHSMAIVLALITSFCFSSVRADTFPNRPLRLVVPFPAGGPTDVVGRIIATDWQERLGQPVIVENKPGAVGYIGHEDVRRAPADGYTILAMVVPAVVNYEFLGKDLELPRDFSAIGRVYTDYNVLVVNAENEQFANVNEVSELFEMARKAESKLDYTSAGNGSLGHLGMARLLNVEKVYMEHIPYRGAAPAILDVLAGHVPIMFSDSVSARPHIKSGKLRALAVTSAEQESDYPDIPTFVESGYDDLVVTTWFGLVAPPDTPAEIASLLSKTLEESLSDPVTRQKIQELGMTPDYMPASEFTDFVNSEFKAWSAVIRDNNIAVNR